MNRFDPFNSPRQEEPIFVDHSIKETDAWYRDMGTGEPTSVQRTEARGMTDIWPYHDPKDPDIAKRIVVEWNGTKLLVMCRRPHFHHSLEPYGDIPLPEDLKGVGVFSTMNDVRRFLSQMTAKTNKESK
jgi:hypothetical protein